MLTDLRFEDAVVEHRVNRRMKHVYIHIEEKRVIIKSPPVSDRYLHELLERKSDWIRKKLALLESREVIAHEFGKSLYFMGEQYLLEGNEAFDDLNCAIGRLQKQNDDSLQRCYDTFYKTRAYDYLGERLDAFETDTGLCAKAMKIRKMKRRWGSCSCSGIITFNSNLMKLPAELIDYVVVHELAHLVELNHSRAFYRVVREILPDYREREAKIRQYRLDY